MSFNLDFFKNLSRNKKDKAFAGILIQLTGFPPRDITVYKLAFTHTSIAPEDKNGFKKSNERLEFLGDTILDSIISHYLYNQYPKEQEGFLTLMRSKIVSRSNLNDLSLKLGLDEILSKVEVGIKGNNIYGNALEALIGAVYIDLGYKKAYKFVQNRILSPFIDIEEFDKLESDFKSKLIHQTQQESQAYEFINDRKKGQFISKLLIDHKLVATGVGISKKEADQDAARIYFEKVTGE